MPGRPGRPGCREGDYDRAAELAGARDALREQIGVFLPPVYPAGYTRTLETARAALGPAAFGAAHARLANVPPPRIIATVMTGLAGPTAPAEPPTDAAPDQTGDQGVSP